MTLSHDNTGKKQAGRFPAGESGNRAGRPKGSRNRTTLALQSLLEGEAETIGRKAIELAKAGDLTAIRLVLERVLPARKDSPVTLELPTMPLEQQDIAQIMAVILSASLAGEITPSEGQALSGLVETYRKAKETTELEQRIAALEGGKHG
jgi:Family of unknown function (DUF5681)